MRLPHANFGRAFVTPNLALREKMNNLETAMLALPQLDIDTINCHGGGIYARTIFLKKGTILTGRIHLVEHINIMSSGDITVATEEGVRRLSGFTIMACKPGSKRVGVVHEDTIWTTILQTDETDAGKIEELFFAKDHLELEN